MRSLMILTLLVSLLLPAHEALGLPAGSDEATFAVF